MQTQLIRQLVLGGVLCAPIMAWARPEMNYGLAFNGDLWGSSFSSSFDFDDGFDLSSMNMNLSGRLLRAQAGDVSASWDQLGLAGRSFQGLSTGFTVGKADLSLLGGTVVLQPDYLERHGDLLAPLPAPVASPIYGVRASLPLNSRFSLSASRLVAPNAPAAQGKNIGTLALNFQPSARQNLALEVSRSRGGSGWQLSGASERSRLRLQASYRQADLGFSTAGNPTLQRRRNGGFVNLAYRLAQPLTLTANAYRYGDGRSGRSNYSALSLRYARPKAPSLGLFWRSSESRRPSIIALASASTSTWVGTSIGTSSASVGIRASHRLGANRISAQVERLRFASISSAALDNTSSRFSVGLSRPLGRRTQLSLFQILDLGTSNRTGYTVLDLRHRVGNSGLTVEMGLQSASRRVAGVSGQATTLRTGFSYALRSGSSLGLQYQSAVSGSGSLCARENSQLYIGYSHLFGSGSGPSRSLTLQERRQMGAVSGRVFEDANGNGKWDSGEPGVPDVTVNSLGGLRRQTDNSGRFSMADVRPGTHQIALETRTLPIEFTCLAAGEVPLQVTAGESATLNIPVVRTGRVRGLVFQDANRNGLCEPGEPGVAGVMVKVAQGDIISFTDSQGRFTLQGLAPGKWQVSVDISTLGSDMESTGPSSADVIVPPNGEVAGVALGVAAQERAVVNGFEASQ